MRCTCAKKNATSTKVMVYNNTLIDTSLWDRLVWHFLLTTFTFRVCVALVTLVKQFSIDRLATSGWLCGPTSLYWAGMHGPKKQRTAKRGSSLKRLIMSGFTPTSTARSSITWTQKVWKINHNFMARHSLQSYHRSTWLTWSWTEQPIIIQLFRIW